MIEYVTVPIRMYHIFVPNYECPELQDAGYEKYGYGWIHLEEALLKNKGQVYRKTTPTEIKVPRYVRYCTTALKLGEGYFYRKKCERQSINWTLDNGVLKSYSPHNKNMHLQPLIPISYEEWVVNNENVKKE